MKNEPQVATMSAMSHRIAQSESESAPMNSAAYRIVPASATLRWPSMAVRCHAPELALN